VSHEEALGGQAIREHAAEYNRLVKAGRLSQARDVLGHLAATRENYIMVDDDFPAAGGGQRAISPTRACRRIASATSCAPTSTWSGSSPTWRSSRGRRPVCPRPGGDDLVSFPRARDGTWISRGWRDSRAGYGGGRFAMDVNAIWVPHALEAWDDSRRVEAARHHAGDSRAAARHVRA